MIDHLEVDGVGAGGRVHSESVEDQISFYARSFQANNRVRLKVVCDYVVIVPGLVREEMEWWPKSEAILGSGAGEKRGARSIVDLRVFATCEI